MFRKYIVKWQADKTNVTNMQMSLEDQDSIENRKD